MRLEETIRNFANEYEWLRHGNYSSLYIELDTM